MEKIEALRIFHELKDAGYYTEQEFLDKADEIFGMRQKRKYTMSSSINIPKERKRKGSRRRWTPDEDKFLLSNTHRSDRAKAKELKRTIRAVNSRRFILRHLDRFPNVVKYKGVEKYTNGVKHENGHALKCNSKVWTVDEDNIILQNYNLGAAELARRLGRTVNSVTQRVWNLKHKMNKKIDRNGKYSRWTPADEEFIIKNFQKLNSTDLAKMLHRTPKALDKQLGKMRKQGKISYKRIPKDDDTIQIGENKYPKKYSQMG